jgi:hypothetical protein
MADRFYPGQKDYISKLNELASEVADLGAGVSGPTLRTATLVTLAGVTLYTLPFAVAGWPAQQPILTVGGVRTVRVQSMTNTDTVDVIGTAIQVKELAQAGSEFVRITVNTPEAAAAVPYIREQLDRMGENVPLVGDFHYNGHKLLTDFPACAEALSKYRINPGNVGKGEKRDRQFGQMIETAAESDSTQPGTGETGA